MSAKKVLFITQEITPYVPESNLALIGQNLPQAIQDKGREIRTFMPKWAIFAEQIYRAFTILNNEPYHHE